MFPGVLLIVSITLEVKKWSFEQTWTTQMSSFHPFLAKSARHKMHPSTSNTDCSAISGAILIILFSLAPYYYDESPQLIWASNSIVYLYHERLNECSNFFGTPGTWPTLSNSKYNHDHQPQGMWTLNICQIFGFVFSVFHTVLKSDQS